MTRHIRSRRRRLSVALPIGSALLAMFAGMAIVVPATGDVDAAQARRDAAAERVARVEAARRELAQYEEELRARGGDDSRRTSFPGEVAPIELFSAVQLCAGAADLVITELVVGEPEYTDLPVWDDEILVREVALRGRGEPRELAALVGGLRGLGYPTAVLDLDVSRESERVESSFGFALTLGVYESAPLAPYEEEQQP